MPLVVLRTTAAIPDASREPLLQELSRLVASQTGKPESYVMTLLEPAAAMTMAGSPAASCFVEVRGVGAFSPKQTASMSKAICALLADKLAVSPSRTYLNFIGFDGAMWGFNGSTFG